MLLSIIKGVPIWVWPLLVLLVFIGLKATRKRTSSAVPMYFLPLLAILSINATNSLPAGGYIWVVFTLGYFTGAWLGFGFQKTITLEKTGNTVVLAGEWITLTVLMVIFWANFIGGMTRAVSPDFYASPVFNVIFVIFLALASGSFLGRAIRVFKHSSPPRPSHRLGGTFR